MSLRLQCLLLLAVSSTLLALPVKVRREDNFEISLERSSRDATEISLSGGDEFFEGDIKLLGQSPYDTVVKRDADGSGDGGLASTPTDSDAEGYKSRTDLWEGGKVLYKFDTILTPMYRDLFKEAFLWWSNATDNCITFKPASSEDEDYLLLRKDDKGCSSYIGRLGGEQFLNISSSCDTVGSAAHELGHALGLWHEQSRPDRDMYINIIYDNIISTEIADKNFGKLSQQTFSQVPLVSYDIESIMHYGSHAFPKDQNKKTIEVKADANWDMCDNPKNMGQRKEISHKDALRVKLLYGCGDVTPTDMPESCEQPTPTPTKKNETIIPTLTRKIETNNVITLQFYGKKYGIKCSPICTPTPCVNFGGGLGPCSKIDSQFRIVKPGDSRIGDGDKVLLRSVSKSSMWLNCSGVNKECLISQCTSNAADPSNSSYISDCEDHFFIIDGVNRGLGKVLSTKHKIQFKSYKDNTYLNCIEKKCRMLEENTCPDKNKVTETMEKLIMPKNGTCETQFYNVTKLRVN